MGRGNACGRGAVMAAWRLSRRGLEAGGHRAAVGTRAVNRKSRRVTMVMSVCTYFR